jgi:hypothetical protein
LTQTFYSHEVIVAIQRSAVAAKDQKTQHFQATKNKVTGKSLPKGKEQPEAKERDGQQKLQAHLTIESKRYLKTLRSFNFLIQLRYRALFREFDEAINSIETFLDLLGQSSSLIPQTGSLATQAASKNSDSSGGADRTVPKNKFIENIFLDLGINAQQELSPYRSAGLFFQLEAVHVTNNKTSKTNNKTGPEIVFNSLAHGGHFDHMIQRYRSPSIANAVGSGLLLAFGVRLSLTRLQELFSTALLRNSPMTPATHQKVSGHIFGHSSLPTVLVISYAEFLAANFQKRSKEGKLPDLFPMQSQLEISYHAEIAVVLYVLRAAGLRAADSLHQLQRDIHQTNKGIARNDSNQSVLSQIASSHGVHYIVALIHGREMRNTVTNILEPAVRVCCFYSFLL